MHTKSISSFLSMQLLWLNNHRIFRSWNGPICEAVLWDSREIRDKSKREVWVILTNFTLAKASPVAWSSLPTCTWLLKHGLLLQTAFKFPASCSLQTYDTRTSPSKDLSRLPPARGKLEAWEISKQQTEKALQGKGDRSLYRTRAGQICKHLHSYKLWEHSCCNQQDLLNMLNMRLVLTYLA